MQGFLKRILTLLSMLLVPKNKNETKAAYEGQENKHHMNYERGNNSDDDE